MTINKKNLLILGGSGFIGSNIAHYFLPLCKKITVLDNFDPKSVYNKYNLHPIKKEIKFLISQSHRKYQIL